jgi:hypothetical protein
MNNPPVITLQELVNKLSVNKYYAVYNSTSFILHRGEELIELFKQDGIHITAPQYLKFLFRHHVSEFNKLDDVMVFFKSGCWKELKAPTEA